MWTGAVTISRKADLGAIPVGEIAMPTDFIYNERTILIEAIENWLETWNQEFGYHDRQASKRRWPNP
jgi:hypothetical protein